jgi:Xaa-Pro aminopeptidase
MPRTAIAVLAALLVFVLGGMATVAADPAETPAGPFPPSVYRERRENVMQEMGEGIAVLHARGREDRDGYRQDSDFYYLTGIEEPGAILILAPGQRTYRHRLYLVPRDPEAERWIGEREPLSRRLLERTGFDQIQRTGSVNRDLMSILETTDTLHVINQPARPDQPLPAEQELYGKIASRIPGVSVNNLSKLLPAMRAVKEGRELERMEKAIDATIAAHRAAARAIRPGGEENWVESLIMTEFKKRGAVRPAFPSIVGSGEDSTILHYPDHDKTIEAGSLVLVDIGAEYGRYAADVTRTYPADGRFNDRQRLVYETVLRAQQACVAMVRPGVYVEDLYLAAEKIIGEAGFADYFIHGIGHFVGLDVHDVGLRNEPLENGMVITIEPGIYIPEENLGVRIEDDVLVTATGVEVLTADLPRSLDEVERMMRGDRASVQ